MFSILIIDPNIPFRKSLSKIIHDRFPYIKVLEASSGNQGLIGLKRSIPTLLFIDIYLPDISGFDLAKKIKTSYPQITIATFASFDSPEYQAAAAACGVEYLIPKDDWSGEKILEFAESVLTNFENAANTPA